MESRTLLKSEENKLETETPAGSSMVAYRVVRVGNPITTAGEVTVTAAAAPRITSAFSTIPVQSTLQGVVANPIGGGLYVLGTPNTNTRPSGNKMIAPNISGILVDTPKLTPQQPRRDNSRRATHNEVERRRRDKINNWIAKLGKLIPPRTENTKNGSGCADQLQNSKGGILAKACEYIIELREANKKLSDVLAENHRITEEYKELKKHKDLLEFQNEQLKILLEENGIPFPGKKEI